MTEAAVRQTRQRTT